MQHGSIQVSSSYTHTYTIIHTYTTIHTYIHKHTHIHTQSYTHTYTSIHTYLHKHTHIHTYSQSSSMLDACHTALLGSVLDMSFLKRNISIFVGSAKCVNTSV